MIKHSYNQCVTSDFEGKIHLQIDGSAGSPDREKYMQ